MTDLPPQSAPVRERTALRLRARWVLPVDAPPIENGEVVVEAGRIVHVGPAHVGAGRDFGLAAVLPGFVNTHTHLEYTLFRGLLEDIPFFPWIREMIRLKAEVTDAEWIASATLGAAEMLAAGVTGVGDCADNGAALDALLASGLGGIVFAEVFGIGEDEPVERIVGRLAEKVTAMRQRVARNNASGRIGIGISPHAPYTVRPALFAALAEYARRAGVRQAIHIAESPAEDDLIRRNAGPFAEMFARRGIPWRSADVSPVRYVADCGGLDAPTLAVHCVHVSDEDAALLAARGASVAHCPKSNGKLGAGVAPLRTLLDAGLAVGLGTDSVASNNAVDLFEEMRSALFAARVREHAVAALDARTALEMATIGGARALGLDAETGTLTPGKRADLCVVRMDGLHLAPAANDDPVAALVYGARAGDVALTIADGRILYDNGRFAAGLPVPHLMETVSTARARLRRGEKAFGEAAVRAAA